MKASHTTPSGAKSAAFSRPIRFTDPDDVRAWLDAADIIAADVIALAREATRPFRQRLLSRPEMRRRVLDSSAELLRLLAAVNTASATEFTFEFQNRKLPAQPVGFTKDRRITYRFDAGGQRIMKRVRSWNTAIAGADKYTTNAEEVYLENVTNLAFTYYDRAGAAMAVPVAARAGAQPRLGRLRLARRRRVEPRLRRGAPRRRCGARRARQGRRAAARGRPPGLSRAAGPGVAPGPAP